MPPNASGCKLGSRGSEGRGLRLNRTKRTGRVQDRVQRGLDAIEAHREPQHAGEQDADDKDFHGFRSHKVHGFRYCNYFDEAWPVRFILAVSAFALPCHTTSADRSARQLQRFISPTYYSSRSPVRQTPVQSLGAVTINSARKPYNPALARFNLAQTAGFEPATFRDRRLPERSTCLRATSAKPGAAGEIRTHGRSAIGFAEASRVLYLHHP